MGWTRVTRVPLPLGQRPILKVPPSSAARSRIPSSPIDFVFEISVPARCPARCPFTSMRIRPSGSFKSDAYMGGARMADDIGERFLKNAERTSC